MEERQHLSCLQALHSIRQHEPIGTSFRIQDEKHCANCVNENYQVSAGVSVGYFSSVGLLGLAAAQPASPSGMGDITTYFDSVVFLTMFLLAGEFSYHSCKDI